jgi:DNA topoisomerase-1
MLFRWKQKAGVHLCLTAEAVNVALRERFGETTSAKDVRTFRASAIVAGALQDAGKEGSPPRLAVLWQAIREASEFLANTPAVCKSSYVHPHVQDAFGDEGFDATPLFAGSPRGGLTRGETALLRLVELKAAD